MEVYESKETLGRAAARAAAEAVADILQTKDKANLSFATGASQFELMAGLREQQIDWGRVVGLHLDEYLGISKDHPASFRRWLQERVVEPFQPSAFYFIEGDAEDTEAEVARYARILEEHPVDLGFVGIGENGHIAFNDPPVADFNDPHAVKVVELDEACRRQQLGEGWFPTFDAVPTLRDYLDRAGHHELQADHFRRAGQAKSGSGAGGVNGSRRHRLPGLDIAHPSQSRYVFGYRVGLPARSVRRQIAHRAAPGGTADGSTPCSYGRGPRREGGTRVPCAGAALTL